MFLNARVGLEETVQHLLEIVTELGLILLGQLSYKASLLSGEIAHLLQVKDEVGKPFTLTVAFFFPATLLFAFVNRNCPLVFGRIASRVVMVTRQMVILCHNFVDFVGLGPHCVSQRLLTDLDLLGHWGLNPFEDLV